MEWGIEMFYALLVVFLATCAVPATAGALFKPGQWYRDLDKPSWTPPNLLFPVIWAVLYVSMSVAAARVATQEASALAIALWGLQIGINTLWSAVFFGLHRILSGVVIIGLLWIAVVATTLAFLSHDRIAAILMVPYLAWGTYAFALNLSVWSRNRSGNKAINAI
jgi:translocator protein